MAEEKQGTVKYELSPDGDLKCKIKREKTVECTEWVTENRGHGLGKLVFKKKSPVSSCQSPKTSGLHLDRQTDQVPVLRLSLTSNASTDGSRQVHVKSWSLCEPEDVSSVSELSPACQLQQSPKDSGIDMSSPPHDDAAVGVEPNVGTGIWSVSDSHNGDSLAVEEEKTTGSPEKLETAAANLVGGIHSSTKALWPDASSCSSSNESQPKVQSTLRSRVERSALKCFTGNSQKLINPLAKTHRVGRYQHMLPVHHIRAEANVSRRSSLEESPTYNMVAPRSASGLPRVKTKLKLLSNNMYTAVHPEVETSEQPVADQKNKCLNAEKSNRTVMECKRKNRLSRKSSASNAFENRKVKLCHSSKNNRCGIDSNEVQRVPKLKLVVKSEGAVSVSCVAQQQDNESTVKRDEENMPRHIRRKRRHHEVETMKACSNNMSGDLCRPVDGFSASRLPSSKTADATSCRPKGKNSEAKHAPVADVERPGRKRKLPRFAEQLTCHVPVLSDSQHLPEDDIDKTLQSVADNASVDEAICDVVTTPSVHTDTHSICQIGVCDAMNEAYVASQEEAVNAECTSADQSKSSAPSTEMDSDGTGTIDSGRVESDKENECSEDACCDSEKCTESNRLIVNAGDDGSQVDGVLEEKSCPLDTENEIPADMQHDFTSNGNAVCDGEAVITEKPCEVIASLASDDTPTSRMFGDSDESGESHHICAVFHEDSEISASEQSTTAFSDTEVPLSSSLLLACDNSVTGNATSTVSPHSRDGDVNKPDVGNLHLTLEPSEFTEDTSYDTVHCQNNNAVVNNRCPIDSSKLSCQDTVCVAECVMECQQDVKQDMADVKEFSEKNLELKSVCSMSAQDQNLDVRLEEIDSDPAYELDIPSHLTPFSAPYCSNEATEIPVFNSACSSGFLAAFTQFVEKASIKKKSAYSKHIETDNSSEATKEILLKSGSSQKCVRRRPCVSERRRRSYSEKQALPKNKLPHRVDRRKSTSTVELTVTEKPSSLETHGSEDVDSSKQLTCTAVDNECPTLSQDQLLNIVAADRLLVTLRHRVCELVETVLPEFQFPPGFRRDSSCVERLVKDITDGLANSGAHSDVQHCSDPVVVLHRMPDKCLQSLRQQVFRLTSLLLPDIDLSEISDDSLDVFLELMTSVNQPLPGTFCVSQPNLYLGHETCTQPLDKVQIPGQQLSPFHAETDFKCEEMDMSLSRTESHMSGVDALFTVPSCLLQINSPGPVGDKRSIRRQVKDCLMFLDRDLT